MMEVEARVSVQAIKGKFEQLYEDSPLLSTSQHVTPTQGRPRAASVPKKETPRSADIRKTSANLLHPDTTNKHENSVIRVRGFSTGETPSSGLFPGTGAAPSSTPRKHSSNLRDSFETKTSDASYHDVSDQNMDHNTPTSVTAVKPSVVRRIPVFKPFDTRLNSDSKKLSSDVEDECVDEPRGIRGKFFTHIRSRSHGNFNMKRDPSVERKSLGSDKNNSAHKENVFHRDWLTPKRKQRSTDSLLYNQDSNSSSTFEGKQKLVANVVKNMKNKDKPTVLRKSSFSSKIEKEVKNMKEKSTNHKTKVSRTGVVLSSHDNDLKGKSKIRGRRADDTATPTDKQKSLIHCSSSESGTVPVAIAREVADMALKKSGTMTAELIENGSSCANNLIVPPSRPPRRRSGSHTSTTHKKGKAPSPPDYSSVSPVTQRHKTENENQLSDEDRHNIDTNGMGDHLEVSCSPGHTTLRNKDCPPVYHSTESLLSYNSADISRENSPIMMGHGSSLSFSDIANGEHITDPKRSPVGLRDTSQANDQNFNYEIQSVHLSNRDRSKCVSDSDHPRGPEFDTLEVQGLPTGPPPKKPPRTFAYDIYKNFKNNRCEEQNDENEMAKENCEFEKCISPPIYAVPVKKKSKCNNFNPKPPIRSKSDLSSKDIAKPSVAPKPPHVLAKAKRTSLVDPLTSYEKEEEMEVASEFQRQAHVRYSLRRPKKPPPTPPPYTESASNDTESQIHINTFPRSQNDSSNSVSNGSNKNEVYSASQTVGNANDNLIEYHNIEYRTSKSPEPRRRPHSNSCLLSPNAGRHDYEDIAPRDSTVGTPSFSAHSLQGPSTVMESEQPMSLGYCSVTTPPPDTGFFTKRSMSDETLYKGCRRGEEPVYATPNFNDSSDSSDQSCHRELHYMCSVLFTDDDDEGGGGGRDGSTCGGRARRVSKDKIIGTEAADGSKGRSGIISAWKRGISSELPSSTEQNKENSY